MAKKNLVGRPKHVAQYATAQESQGNFINAMKVILAQKKPTKKRAA